MINRHKLTKRSRLTRYGKLLYRILSSLVMSHTHAAT